MSLLRSSAPLALLLACAAGVVPAAALGADRTGSISGRVAGTLPKRGQGEVDLRVIDLAGGRIAAARTLGRTGVFALRLPAGAYALRTSVAAKGLRMPSVGTLPVTLRAGQRRRKLTLKVKKRRVVRPRAAFVQESGKSTAGTAVTIEPFSGAEGDLSVMNRGLSDMLIVDTVQGVERCKGVVAANSEDRKLIEEELNLQKSPAFDPAERSARDWVLPDIVVRGRLENNASGGLDYRLTLEDARSGETLDTITGSLDGQTLFADAEQVGKELVKRVCRQPQAYQLTLDAQATGEFIAYTAKGTARGILFARAQNGDADTAPTRWASEPSAVDWSGLSFTTNAGPCTWVAGGPLGQWGVTIRANGDGLITVTTQGIPGAKTQASALCPNVPPLTGQAGPALAGITPEEFVLPAGGGKQKVGGVLVPWSSTGTITVRPSAAPR